MVAIRCSTFCIYTAMKHVARAVVHISGLPARRVNVLTVMGTKMPCIGGDGER